MKVVAIIQARMRSTRLPGKIMEKLCGHTVLTHDIRRVRAARRVDAVVVATSDLTVDDQIAAEAARAGAAVSRGSETDVLARYFHAAQEHAADIIVRITSDCPLFDPELLDRMLVVFIAALEADRPYDYYSNTLGRRTYPTGLDAEIFTMAALQRAFVEGRRPAEREHVTPYLHQNPDLFRLGGMTAEVDHSNYRWTLDTPEDLALIRKIYAALYREDRLFTTAEVLDLMAAQPDLARINSLVQAKPIDPDGPGELVIRADASTAVGAGHLMRCLALAQAWRTAGGGVRFVMAEGAAAFGPRLRAAGMAVVGIPATVASAADARRTLAVVADCAATWLVVDGYRFDQTYLLQLAEGAAPVLLLDDCGRNEVLPVDILLNQNIHADKDLYPSVTSRTELLLGVRHVLLRQEFMAAGLRREPPPPVARRLLVTLGGGDPENYSGRVLDALSGAVKTGLAVRVLMGAANDHRDDLRARAAASPLNVEVLGEVTDMPAQYRWADLAVTAGGGTLWELARAGVPALTLIVADNQEPASLLLDRMGVIDCLGRAHELDFTELSRAVVRLAGDLDARARMITAGQDLIDGQGAARVVAAMRRRVRPEATA